MPFVFFSKSFFNFISHPQGLDVFVSVVVFHRPLLFWHLIFGFWPFYNLSFITQKHAYFEKLQGLSQANYLKKKSGEERCLLDLRETWHCGGGASLEYFLHLHGLIRFSLPYLLPFQCGRDHSRVSTGVSWVLGPLQGSTPVVFLAEGQYVENPGCHQYGIKKKAEREQMKIATCIFNYFLHFALTLKFRKYVFTQETFKFLCHSQCSPFSFLIP